jgi:N utilization substance protein B
MASPRDVRRLALLALYQLDLRGGADPEQVRDSLDDAESFVEEGLAMADPGSAIGSKDLDKAFALAMGAYEHIGSADRELGELSTEWRVERMPAVDRAILRLAHYEMTVLEDAKPRASVHEAVELAKQFSTKESPGFVNAILDRVLKRLQVGSEAGSDHDPIGEG